MSWGQAQPPPACVSCCHVPSMCSLLVHGENPANAPKVKDKLLVRDQCAIFCHGWESQIFQKEMSKYGWLRQFSSSWSLTLHSYPFYWEYQTQHRPSQTCISWEGRCGGQGDGRMMRAACPQRWNREVSGLQGKSLWVMEGSKSLKYLECLYWIPASI